MVALVERRDGAALQEFRRAGARILDEILDDLPVARGRRQPADAPAGHGPVLGHRVDVEDRLVRLRHVVEGGRALVLIEEARIDLVGDDPEPARARKVADGDQLIAGGGPAGRVAGRIQEQRRRPSGDGVEIAVEIERPAGIAEAHRHLDGARAANLRGGGEVRPGRRRHHNLVALARHHAQRDLDGRHAARGHEEALGIEGAAIEPLVIARDGKAQLGNAALMGIEGLAGLEAAAGRFRDEGRRRQVALADPQGDQALAVAAIVEDLDDAGFRRGRGLVAQPMQGGVDRH